MILAASAFWLFNRVSAGNMHCSVGPVHCSQDPKYFIQKKTLKMGPTVLFTHLKIILLQYFQFSTK